MKIELMLKHETQLNEKLKISNQELESTTDNLQIYNNELVEIQNELNKTIKKLEISNRELEQFAYVASHDLQEPLHMVSSFAQLLEMKYKGKLDADANDYIDFIVDGSHQMKDLIDDLLEFSRLNTRSKPFELFNMQKALERVLTYLKPIIDENNAKITYDSLPRIMGDESQIQQLLLNLLSNAIKFQKKIVPAHINISSEDYGDEWRICVSDNGIGVDPGNQEKIFDIFKRLHTQDEYSGTGIGLAISKKIIDRHGGRIWVESEPGKGATFYFTLPKV